MKQKLIDTAKYVMAAQNYTYEKVAELMKLQGFKAAKESMNTILRSKSSVGISKLLDILSVLGCKVHIAIEQPFNGKILTTVEKLSAGQSVRLWEEIRNAHSQTTDNDLDVVRFLSNYTNKYVKVLASTPKLVIIEIVEKNLQLRYEIL